jgi:pyridoxal phosphate enzyme (YggS family)
MTITDNVKKLLARVPAGVRIVGAAKGATAADIGAALEAGLTIIGENYLQEAEAARRAVARPAEWHCIGHLQTNKVKKAVELFDLIETVDSVHLAAELEKRCEQAGKVMPVLIEVNSGREAAKTGVLPEDAEPLVRDIAGRFARVRVTGLMTMGPLTGDPADLRRCFRETRRLFEELRRTDIPGAVMRELSMGMSASWETGIEEGATLVRIGTLIFGPRG